MKYRNYSKENSNNKSKHIKISKIKRGKKTRYIKEKHIGIQPIRVLHDSIGDFFVNMSSDFSDELKAAIEYGGFNSTLKLDSDEGFSDIASITFDKKQIHLSETFLSYLWCICYCLIIFLKYFHPLHQNMNKEIDENTKRKYKDDCITLFKYALSLAKDGYSAWDIENLPNPEYYDELENPHIETANIVYTIAVNFILAHEFAHFQLGHLDTYIHEIEDEIHADDYAFRTMMESNYSTATLEMLKYGCISGLCSLIFLTTDLKGEADGYPDGDDRIKIVLEKYATDDDDILWNLAAMSLLIWAYTNKIFIRVTLHKTHKELFEIVSEQIK